VFHLGKTGKAVGVNLHTYVFLYHLLQVAGEAEPGDVGRGGLLMAIKEDYMDRFSREASRLSLDYWPIGRFVEGPKGTIQVK
jgi:hypothetical protein